MSPLRIGCLAAAAFSAAVAFVSVRAAPAAPAVIELRTYMFAPKTLTVTAGTRVTWKNRDPEPHTVASVDGKFRSGALDEGESFSFVFDLPGTYRYVCSIHPQMAGTIVVTAAKH